MFFFLKQKKAYERRISDWSSDVCSSDLQRTLGRAVHGHVVPRPVPRSDRGRSHIALRLAHRRPDRGRASGVAVSGGAAFGHFADEAAYPPDPQPDRATPYRIARWLRWHRAPPQAAADAR